MMDGLKASPENSTSGLAALWLLTCGGTGPSW
jgi:hypothetical protein